jgi:hypothetical protein
MTAAAAAPLLCVGPQALVCGGVLAALTVGALIYGMNSSSGDINSANGAADKDLAGTDAQPCTGQCAEDCARLIQQIEAQATEVQGRLEAMVLDQHDLYNTARGLADDWGKGSWQGHINFYEKERDILKSMIALADSKGCVVPQWVRDVANEGPPNRPGYN